MSVRFRTAYIIRHKETKQVIADVDSFDTNSRSVAHRDTYIPFDDCLSILMGEILYSDAESAVESIDGCFYDLDAAKNMLYFIRATFTDKFCNLEIAEIKLELTFKVIDAVHSVYFLDNQK